MSYTNLGWVVLYNDKFVSPYFDNYDSAYSAMLNIVKARKPFRYSFKDYQGKKVVNEVPSDWKSLTIAERYSIGCGYGRHHSFKYSRYSLVKEYIDNPKNRKKDGLTIWVYSYSYIDDSMEKSAYCKDNFIGTSKDWRDYVKETQDGWGCSYWNIVKRHATKEEIIELMVDYEDDIPF